MYMIIYKCYITPFIGCYYGNHEHLQSNLKNFVSASRWITTWLKGILEAAPGKRKKSPGGVLMYTPVI